MGSPDYRKLMLQVAEKRGIAPFPSAPAGVDVFLPFLEQMRNEGAVVLLKLDGQRGGTADNGPYTALVSGPPLGEEKFYRIDAESIEEALSYIVVSFAQLRWGIRADL